MSNEYPYPINNPEEQKEVPENAVPPVQAAGDNAMPQWLQSELGANPEIVKDEVVSRDEQGHEAATSQEEVRRLREELASQQQQLNRMRSQMAYQSSQPYVVQERGGCLTAFLIFVGILNLIVLGISVLSLGATGGLGFIDILLRVIIIVGVVGAWQLKRWGVYTLMTMYAIGLIIAILELMTTSGATGAFGSIVGSVIGIALLYGLTHNRWEAFE